MPIENIRISKKGRDQLVSLKRKTKIQNWNIICRWAFCLSLAEKNRPREEAIPADSPVEMTWRTFGGEYDALYWSLLKQRCKDDGMDLDDSTLSKQFRLHLHRGLGYLAGNRNIRNISDLIQKAMSA
jgi:DNA sulfur modification protein DndE